MPTAPSVAGAVAVALLASLEPALARAEDKRAGGGPSEGPQVGDEILVPTPPGTSSDQALWRRGADVSTRIIVERVAAARLQWQARSGQYLERLSARARAAAPTEAARIEDLRQRLLAAWTANYVILTDRWPVDPTRGCHYPVLNLQSAMYVSEGPDKAVLLGQGREEVQRCVAAATQAIGRMKGANDALEALLAEADRVMAPPPVQAPAGGSSDPR